MGFFDRFRKKKKAKNAEAAAAAPAEQPKAAAAPIAEEPLPDDPVLRSIALARRANKANVEAGKYDQKRADMFEAQIAAAESADVSDDVKMVDVSQIMGGMNRAVAAVANAAKAA